MFSASRRNVEISAVVELHVVGAREIHSLEGVRRTVERERADVRDTLVRHSVHVVRRAIESDQRAIGGVVANAATVLHALDLRLLDRLFDVDLEVVDGELKALDPSFGLNTNPTVVVSDFSGFRSGLPSRLQLHGFACSWSRRIRSTRTGRPRRSSARSTARGSSGERDRGTGWHGSGATRRMSQRPLTFQVVRLCVRVEGRSCPRDPGSCSGTRARPRRTPASSPRPCPSARACSSRRTPRQPSRRRRTAHRTE